MTDSAATPSPESASANAKRGSWTVGEIATAIPVGYLLLVTIGAYYTAILCRCFHVPISSVVSASDLLEFGFMDALFGLLSTYAGYLAHQGYKKLFPQLPSDERKEIATETAMILKHVDWNESAPSFESAYDRYINSKMRKGDVLANFLLFLAITLCVAALWVSDSAQVQFVSLCYVFLATIFKLIMKEELRDPDKPAHITSHQFRLVGLIFLVVVLTSGALTKHEDIIHRKSQWVTLKLSDNTEVRATWIGRTSLGAVVYGSDERVTVVPWDNIRMLSLE